MALCSQQRTDLVAALKGQTLCIPDFETLFVDWPRATNYHLEWLRGEVDVVLQNIVSKRWPAAEQTQILHGLRRADFGLFGAHWWPWAHQRALKTLTMFVIWLFLWDDEIDAEVGALATDWTQAQKYREETLDYVKKWLGLTNDIAMPTHPNILVSSFAPIGREAMEWCTFLERKKLYEEIELYIRASEEEQRRRLSPDLPSPEEYWQCRTGTSAVGACLGLLEYAHSLVLPENIMSDPDMIALWDQTNIVISGTNDILSLKKELKADTPDSLIPLLYRHSLSLDKAVEEATATIGQARRDFDTAASTLWSRYGPDADLHQFIVACKANCTGNLHWSLLTGRYGLGLTELRPHTMVVL